MALLPGILLDPSARQTRVMSMRPRTIASAHAIAALTRDATPEA